MSNDPEILEIPVLPRLESLSSYSLKAFAVTVLGTLALAAIAILQEQPQQSEDTVGIVLAVALASALVVIPLFAYHRQSQRPGVLRIEPNQVTWRDAVLGGEVAF